MNQNFLQISSRSWLKATMLGFCLVAFSAFGFAQIYDNGTVTNSPGTGSGGADESILQTTTLGMNILGFGHQVGFGNSIADDFEVPEGEEWNIDDVVLFAYQTGSSTASTITDIRVRIWDGVPGDVGSTVIFGDLVTNLLASTSWSGTYRVTETTTGTATNRPIMQSVATLGVTLEEGTYWIEWQADGSLASGPWAPPITITGQPVTGNGLQSVDNGVTFAPVTDISNQGDAAQGFPFIFNGTISTPNPGQVVNLAAITNVNVTLDVDCGSTLIPSQILVGDFDVDGDGAAPDADLFNIVVEDEDPTNGPVIDGCGTWTWTATNMSPDSVFSGFTSAWGFVNAEDKTSPAAAFIPDAPAGLFCDDIEDININLLASSISRCWTQSGSSSATINGSMNAQLRLRLLAGGGIPNFTDGCSNVEICVNDIVTNNGACDSTVITRVFTATDGDCPSVSGEENEATVASYDIVFGRPGIADVVGVDSVSIFSCDANPPLLPPNDFGQQNPAPTPQDFPFILREDGSQVFLDEDGFCNLGATFQDGPRITTCPQTYKFVRTFTVIDWCDVNNIRTFTQLVKVGDFTDPVITEPTQDLDFNGIPDQGPLFFSTNTSECTAIFVIPAGSATDNCDPNPQVRAVIYPFGDTQALGFGPYDVGALTLDGIPRGTHTIRYFAVDACGNESTLDKDVTIGDETAPAAICEDGLNVSIGGPIGGTGGIAQLCAEDVNAASYDDCSDIDLDIRVTLINGVPVPVTDPLYQWQACHILTCDELGTIEVELRVTDEEGNSNSCWLDVLVEDKLAPICLAPPPVTVTCADLADGFPQDLNVEFANDPIGTAALLDAQFGEATGLDNCPDPVVTQTVFDGRNSCGVGTITRSFTVTDAEDFTSPPNCTQIVTVESVHDYTVVFPGDAENDDCLPQDYNGVTYTENGCDLIAVATSLDTFTATADECYKVRVTYEVINWCEYNTINDPYIIPRDADNDDNLNEITVLHVLPRLSGNADDIAYLDRDENRFNGFINELDTGDGGILPGTNVAGYGQDLSRGAFIYNQFVKIYDDTPPTLVIDEADPTCSFDGVNCDADVELTFTIDDDCSPASVNAIVELDEFIPAGTYTLADFVADANVTSAATNVNGNFTVNLDDVAIGRHALRIRATDGCGNTAIGLQIFEVIDCKAPTPICINGLTVTLMPDGDGGGMAEIWVSDFIASPSADCSGPVKFAIYTNDEVLAAGDNFVPNPAQDTGLVLTCNSDETTMVRIYAVDANGQFDYCLTSLLVQDNGVCDGPGSDVNSLAGVIMTEAAGVVPGVNVTISGAMSNATTTDAQGLYNFSNLATGQDYTVAPEFDNYDYHLSGVSTFDLVLISQHILGLSELSSGYALLAADANADENVSVQDIIAIRRLILGLDLAYVNSPAWRFVDADFSFPAPTNPWATTFPEVYNINNIATNVLDADFVAIMIGNVDGNGMANLTGQAEDRTNGTFGFDVADANLIAGNTYTVDFTAADAAALEGFQGTVKLAEGLEFIGLEYGVAQAGNFNTAMVSRGIIAMSYNTNGNEINSDDVLFSVVVRATGSAKLSDALTINSDYTAAEAYTNGQIRSLGINFAGGLDVVAANELLQNTPNPVADVTTIGFNLVEAAEVNITVQDVTGKVVLRKTTNGAAGYNSIMITRDELNATGVLTYTMVAGDYTATKKMVVVK